MANAPVENPLQEYFMTVFMKALEKGQNGRLRVVHIGTKGIKPDQLDEPHATEGAPPLRLNKRSLRVLDKLVIRYLFENQRWPSKNVDVVLRVLERYNLLVRGRYESWYTTRLGDHHKVPLVMTFAGIVADEDTWRALYEHGFMHEREPDLYRDFRGDVRAELRAMRIVTRDAYFQFYCRQPRQSSRFPLEMQAFAADDLRQFDDSLL